MSGYVCSHVCVSIRFSLSLVSCLLVAFGVVVLCLAPSHWPNTPLSVPMSMYVWSVCVCVCVGCVDGTWADGENGRELGLSASYVIRDYFISDQITTTAIYGATVRWVTGTGCAFDIVDLRVDRRFSQLKVNSIPSFDTYHKSIVCVCE